MYKGIKAKIIQTIVIAAAYVVLTYVADMFGMAKGIVQVRISDALCILPYFTPAAIPGLFIGCLISNTVIHTIPADIIYGSLATLLAAIVSYIIRKKKFMVCIPPIIFNTVAVNLLFHYAYRYEDSVLKCVMTVGIGEIVACGLLGTALLLALEDSKDKLFPGNTIEPSKDKTGIYSEPIPVIPNDIFKEVDSESSFSTVVNDGFKEVSSESVAVTEEPVKDKEEKIEEATL